MKKATKDNLTVKLEKGVRNVRASYSWKGRFLTRWRDDFLARFDKFIQWLNEKNCPLSGEEVGELIARVSPLRAQLENELNEFIDKVLR